MTIQQIREQSYGNHLANILEYEQKEHGLDISNGKKLQQILDWWLAEGLDKYIRIKAANSGEKKPTFKESGQMVIEKFKELKG